MRVLAILLITALFPGFLAKAAVIYEVASDKAHVRVDSTITSESLGFLHKGEIIEVLDEKFDWYKVILPRDFISYISKDFIKLTADNRLEVTGVKVNLRSRAALDSAVIGKASKGDIFSFIESSGDWFKVETYPHAAAWVHKNNLRQINLSSDLSNLTDEIWPKLSLPDIKNKLTLHKYLIDKGKEIAPLLEAKIPESNASSVYSLIDILSQIALNQTESGDWELASRFLETAKKSAPRQASVYLDILQNILLEPQEKKEAYFYLYQNNRLSAENIKTAMEWFSNKLSSIDHSL